MKPKRKPSKYGFMVDDDGDFWYIKTKDTRRGTYNGIVLITNFDQTHYFNHSISSIHILIKE